MPWSFMEDPEIAPDALVAACLTNGRHKIHMLGYLRIEGRSALLWDLHVQGAGPNTLGLRALRGLAEWAMELLDVDELRI